ncbi:MAG: hypothetical protein ABWZ27_12060 [Aestuariivirgaceae bacterium]
MRTIAALAVASMLAFCPAAAPAAAQESGDGKLIQPSVVYRIVKEYAPGATVLRVTLQPDTQNYAVRLKSGSTVRLLVIDGRSGRIIKE